MSLLNPGGGSSPSRQVLARGKDSRLFAEFKGFIRKEGLFPEHAPVLVAVSGGPDSVCLLNLLFLLSRSWSIRLAVAHMDHGLRGAESVRDAEFVRQICTENGIACFIERADVRAEAKKQAMGIQEAARHVRYAFLRRVAAGQGISFVATGHTRDDQAEEILFRLIRGAGPAGMAGIRLKRADGVVRPLLFCTKERILEHLERYDIPFVSDSSNRQLKYTRNRIRRLVLPVMKREINPSAVDCLYRFGRIMAEENQALDTVAEKAYGMVSRGGEKARESVLSRAGLLELSRAVRKRIYRKAMVDAGISPERIGFDHLEKMDRIVCSLKPSCRYFLPSGYVLHRDYDLVHLGRERSWKGPDKREFFLEITGPGRFRLPAGAGQLILEEASCRVPCRQTGKTGNIFSPRPLFLSLRETAFPFLLTFRQKADRFQPLGWERPGKLKKFLINRHVPRAVRDILPILRKGDEIVALCGVEISQAARIMPGDRSCIRLIWRPGDVPALSVGPGESPS